MTESNNNESRAPSEAGPLAEAERLFEGGDFKKARSLARQALGSSSLNTEEQASAAQILKSSGVDPAAVVIFAISLGLFGFLLVRYLLP